MNPKIMKLRGELEKNKGKISDLQGRNRELEKQMKRFILWMARYISMCSIQTAVGTIRSTTRKAKSCWMVVLLTAAPLKIRRLHLLPGLSERRYLPFRA